MLKQFNVFIPTRRLYSVGVVYADPDISEEEIGEEAISEYPINIVWRIKKRVNHELENTYFVKISFE
jgi:hypothetical protein